MVLIGLHFQDTLNMDKTTIIKIADLAKIEIKDDELNDITDSLKKILNLVDEMNSVKTDDVVPMSHPLNLSQELRKDEVLEDNKRDVFQKDNKYTENGYYKVPKIID
jgi:aspartyl-tRNA(Asn)/glutamyl-tRNA(Gln) amidotransferase subunit C